MCDDSLIYFFWGENILKWQNYNDGDLDIDDGGDDFNVTTLVTAMTGPQSFKRPEAAYAVVKHQPPQLVATETRTQSYIILHMHLYLQVTKHMKMQKHKYKIGVLQ